MGGVSDNGEKKVWCIPANCGKLFLRKKNGWRFVVFAMHRVAMYRRTVYRCVDERCVDVAINGVSLGVYK